MNDLLAALQSIDLATEIEVSLFSDEPKYPSYFCQQPVDSPYKKGEPYGLSLGARVEEARTKALAEFYERLCLFNVSASDELLPWDQKSGWIDPTSLALTPSESLREGLYSWLDATEVDTDRKTKIPAQVVIPEFGAAEHRIVDAVGSSGAALGSRGDGGSLKRGLFEVIERHTAARLSLEDRLKQRITGRLAQIRPIEATLRRYGLEPYVFLLPAVYETPCVLVAITDRSGVAPALSLATRAAPTFTDAIYTALFEALERRRPARIEELGRTPDSTDPRIYPWETMETLDEIEPLLTNAVTIPFSALPETPRTTKDLLACFAADDLDVFSVDLTLPEVAAAGFEATKIVIPGLGPMPA